MTDGLKLPFRLPVNMSRRWRLFWMVVATLALVGVAPLAAVGAVFSPLVFDNRDNLLNPLAWLSFLLMIGLWIVCLMGPFAAWIAWRREREPLAWAFMAAPLAWFVVMMAVLQFVPP